MDDSIAEWNQYWEKIEADIRFTLGIELVEVDDRHVVMRMPFKPDISQATGLFSAGALIQLADIAATWLSHLHLRTSQAPEGSFAFAVQLSANLVGNTDHGDALARARILSAGRTLIVTQTEVTDDSGRMLVTLTGTHVVRTPR